jgi:phospholipid N-methyltransferase
MISGVSLHEARTIVELGPGTGAFTEAVLECKPTEALFLALELNGDFVEDLRGRFPGVEVVHDSAENLPKHLQAHGRKKADLILCGLPWAGFPQELQDRLMRGILESLAPGGTFATFAYIHAAWFPAARRFRRFLKQNFAVVRQTPVVWRNVPPAFVYQCIHAGTR